MDLPTYKGEPLSMMASLGIIDSERTDLWAWVPLWCYTESKQKSMEWYQLDAPTPVMLTFSLPAKQEGVILPLLNPFPLPQIGEYGIIGNHASGTAIQYHIKNLPVRARRRWEAIGELLRQLSEPLNWPQHRNMHRTAYHAVEYQRMMNDLYTRQLLTYAEARIDVLAEINMYQAYRLHTQQLHELLSRDTCKAQWEEVQRMANQLGQDYYEHHEKKQRGYVPPLPDLTSQHQTTLPSNNHFRAIEQSFGPILNRGLWNTEDSDEQQLRTPNGAILVARGENGHEQKALHEHIAGGMGVEGIKYMLSLLAAYHDQTGAVNRKDDARVTLRQLLIRMGRGDHADDLDEQRKLMHYILYLSRTWVTALEKETVRPKKGRPPKTYREYTPLIVLEALGSDERGGIRVPDAIEFHLGKEFWEQMFGEYKHFFTIPTTLILQYHSVREQQEICLALYLANMLNLNHGSYSIHFPVLLIQTALQDQENIDQGTNRTRDALRVIYALERLEKDNLLKREAHPDIDIALAADFYIQEKKKDAFSDATLTRIHNAYKHFQRMQPIEIKRRKREALQRLLDTVDANSILFKSGLLINGQIEKRTQGRQLAIDRREQAQIAAQRGKGKKRT